MRTRFISVACCAVLAAFSSFVHAQEPNLAVIPAPREDLGNFKKHLSIAESARQSSPDVVFLGDSITQQWENKGRRVWDEKFAGLKPFNAGISGDRTEHILWRVMNHGLDFKTSPKVCVLMIGTNNTGHKRGAESAEYTADGIASICKALNVKYPKMKILLLGILPRGAGKDDALRMQNDKINGIISKIKLPYVTYLDISSAFLDDEGNLSKTISPDLLHFNNDGYVIYADAILPSIRKLMKK